MASFIGFGVSVRFVTSEVGGNAGPSERRSLLLASVFGLLALGALQALYGPAFPSLMARFGVGVDAVGTTVILHFAGGFASTLAAPLLLLRLGYRMTLRLAGSAAAGGMVLAAVSPSWPILLVAAALAGVGFGLFNIVMNLLVTRTFTTRAAPYLNFLSAIFGVGAIAGPALVVVLAGSLAPLFLLLGGSAALATLFATRAPNPVPEKPVSGADAPPWGLGVGFALVYLTYVSMESSVGAWETVHLEPFVGLEVAGLFTSGFWVAMTVGRFVAIPISTRVRPRYIVLVASFMTLIAVAFTHVPAIAPAAYVAAGLFMAPIFSTTLAWIAAVFPKRSERVIPIALAVGAIGPIAVTGPIGLWVAVDGTGVIASALTLLASCMFVVASVMLWATRTRGIAKV